MTYIITPHRNGYRVTDERGHIEIVSGKLSMTQRNVFTIADDCRYAGALEGDIENTKFNIDPASITVRTVPE